MRIDQWLWAVRLYRTRTLATTAIRSGQVTVDGVSPKPALEVRPGQTVAAKTGDLTRTYRVIGTPKSRVGAPLVAGFAEDLTPASEFERAKQQAEQSGFRPRGTGRPTKKDRRQILRWSGNLGD